MIRSRSYAETWWEWITGPSRLVNNLADLTLNVKSVLINIPCNMPWLDEMRHSVERHLEEEGRSVLFVDVAELWIDNSFDNLFLKRITDRKTALEYMPHKETLKSFVSRHALMNERIVWFINIPYDGFGDFLKRIKGIDASGGSMIVEYVKDQPIQKNKIPGNMTHLDARRFITHENTRLLIHYMCAESSVPSEMVGYIVAIVVNMFGHSPELAVHFFHSVKFNIDDPVGKALQILRENVYDDTKKMKSNEAHVIGNRVSHDLKRQLWKAQISILYPMIEEERVAFIEKHTNVLEAIKPDQDQFGNPVDTVYDMDIGLLYHRINTHSVTASAKALRASDDFQRICFIRDIRNKLAHNSVCDVKDIHELVAKHKSQGDT